MEAYLQQFQLSNYRSCIKTTINFQPNLSTLIGVNGSGKSNVLNGITLLNKTLHRRQYLDERGNPFICKLRASFKINEKALKYQALIRYTNNEKNIDSIISAEEKWNFVEFTNDKTWINAPISFLSNLRRLRNTSSRQLTFFEDDIAYRYRLDKNLNIE